MAARTFRHIESRGAIGPLHTRPFVSSLRVEVLGGHAHVRVWIQGQMSGTLVVDAADAMKLVDRLLPSAVRTEDVS